MEEFDLELSNIFNELPEVEEEETVETITPEVETNVTLTDTLSETFDALPVNDNETFSDIFDQMFENSEEVPKQNLGSTVEAPYVTLMREVKRLSADGPIDEEVALNSPTIMQGIKDIMKSRRIATTDYTAFDEKYDRDLSGKELYEEWQNWMRSLEGGQTITSWNDFQWSKQSNDADRFLLGASLELFDAGRNIFDRDTSWTEFGDGLRDYTRAAFWDPTTAVGLGVGKLFGTAVAKGTVGFAMRQIVKEMREELVKTGATKSFINEQVRNTLKQGFKSAGRKRLGRLAAITSVDIVSSVGSDYVNQSMRIGSGIQEKYSAPQSVGSAMGVILLPSLMAGMRAVDLGTKTEFIKRYLPDFASYQNIWNKLGGQSKSTIEKNIMDQVDLSKVNGNLKSVFERFKNDLDLGEFLPYMQARDAAEKLVTKKDIAGNPLSQENFFEITLTNNFVEALSEAGFRYAPREADDNVSKFITDAMVYLDDSTVASLKGAFIEQFGELPDSISKVTNGKDLSAWFLNRGRSAGQTLGYRSQMSKLLKKEPGDITVADLLSAAQGGAADIKPGPQRVKYLQSIWKRMVTSHPSTIGLNVKGWAYTHNMGIASDAVMGFLHAVKFEGRKSRGSLLGATRKGLNLLTPEATIDSADAYIKLFPEVGQRLYAERAGGIDHLKILENLGLDPNAKVNKLTEASISKLQKFMGVQLQDEITKSISFMGEIDKNIQKHYGFGYNKFMNQPDAYAKMFSEDYLSNVLEPSLAVAKRETYSTSWAGNPNKTLMGMLADNVEKYSNRAGTGLLLPFGRFFNTATATLGDHLPLNALRHIALGSFEDSRGLSAKGIKATVGRALDDKGTELMAKSIVGVGLIYGISSDGESNFSKSKDKVSNGLTWNQIERADGSIADVTAEFPEAYVQIISHGLAHLELDGRIPAALQEEAFKIMVSNTFRDSGAVYEALKNFMGIVADGDKQQIYKASLGILSDSVGKVAAGAIRPAEPFNQALMFYNDDFEQKNINSGSSLQKLYNKSFRYINQLIPPVGSVSTKASVTRDDTFVDIGKTLGGVRSTSGPTPSERVLGSISEKPWQAIEWGGSSEYKNRMNGLVSEILNFESTLLIEDGFLKLPLTKRLEEVTRLKERVRKRAVSAIATSTNVSDKIYLLENKIKRLSGKRNKDLLYVLDYLEYDGDIEDIKGEVGGEEKLEFILILLENKDEGIFREISK